MSKFFIIGCVLILAGCSSMNPFKDDKVELEKVKGNEVPEWFLSKEESNSKHITVTATDVSKDMQFAIDRIGRILVKLCFIKIKIGGERWVSGF